MGLVNTDGLNKTLFDFFTTITFKQETNINLLNFDRRVNNGSKRNITTTNDSISPLNCLNVYFNEYKYCLYTK